MWKHLRTCVRHATPLQTECLYIAKSCWLLWFECSVHVSDGFPKKEVWMGGGWVGWALSKFFAFFEFVLTLQSPLSSLLLPHVITVRTSLDMLLWLEMCPGFYNGFRHLSRIWVYLIFFTIQIICAQQPYTRIMYNSHTFVVLLYIITHLKHLFWRRNVL